MFGLRRVDHVPAREGQAPEAPTADTPSGEAPFVLAPSAFAQMTRVSVQAAGL